MNNIICIAGPTASGKTALSIALAKELGGEIVSCDSMQVYKRMDIGTAKPTAEEMDNIPHHMLSVAEPWEDFSVGKYCDMATPIVDDILARDKTAIIVGGTGLYMDALIRGNAFAPCPSTGCRERLEKLANAEGIEAVIQQLREVDPESAQRLHPSDQKRIIRAMEVYLETGKTITQHNLETQQIPPRYNPVWFALEDADRATLYERIDRRVEEMLRQGLLEEIKSLLKEGVPEKCTAMQAIGYKEFVDALAGRSSIETATELVQQASRKYAKRQLTWFRRNPAIHWLRRESGEGTSEILSKARQVLAECDK
ncbi:MAG: tRNA (adenosine(37)-N6)-dimethylallyltransferase MiaA [Oscillospiraceae bacterium]|nr:tRNA (adenosine(37)-N6)-dimethylallyltransferase MiaA [Oscillospiraceae bacterium]